MAHQKLTKAQAQYLIQQYQRGRSTKCIGDELGIDSVTVGNYLRRAEVDRRPAVPVTQATSEIIDLALDMRSKGKLWKQIEAKIGITKNTLLKHIKRRKDAS